MNTYEVSKHQPSLLPDGKKWSLVWSDEFDGEALDTEKWRYREYMMGVRQQSWTDGEAHLDGSSNLVLSLTERDGDFYTSQLETGENYMDRPGKQFAGGRFSWPIAKISQPKFQHRFGYYECRCRLQQKPGWWSAFWLQSPIQGSTLNSAFSGVEVDIMESFAPGTVTHNIHWNGCGSEKHDYDKPRIISTIRTLQPEIRIFSLWDPDTRWVGNEDGYADMPNINVLGATNFSVLTDDKEEFGRKRYLPAECDMKMRSTWFDCELNENTVKTLDELVGIYEYSVGRGANMLLNIGPDRTGKLPEPDLKRLKEFGNEIRRRYAEALPFSAPVRSDNAYTISFEENEGDREDLSRTAICDTVVISEDITDGEAIESFRVYAKLPRYRKCICVYIGETVGHKAICHFPTMRTRELTVEILKSDGEAKIADIKAYMVGGRS